MRHIRRAAVTGLMAVWLAPLSAFAEGSATDGTVMGLRIDRPAMEGERAAGQPMALEELREARRRLLSDRQG